MSKTKKMVQLSLLVAVGIALHVFEAMLPALNVLPIPGAKLGLANIVTLLTLVFLGYREALGVVLLRSLLASLVAGTFLTTTFYLSFAGALGSGLVMGLLYLFSRGRFSLVGISICGAVAHNVSQLLVAALLIQQAGIFMYLPYLLLFALPTGYFTGLVVRYLLRYSSLGFNTVDKRASYNKSMN
ncbi:MAG TPA: Gx transporter family protein [Firmicutes bacterium]|nr:Gx transporter family protein [Bacillota bacterium]